MCIRDSPVTIVVGHTPLPEVRFGPGIIGTDTTGGTHGELSCVLLPENVEVTSGDEPPRQVLPVHGKRSSKSKAWWKIW